MASSIGGVPLLHQPGTNPADAPRNSAVNVAGAGMGGRFSIGNQMFDVENSSTPAALDRVSPATLIHPPMLPSRTGTRTNQPLRRQEPDAKERASDVRVATGGDLPAADAERAEAFSEAGGHQAAAEETAGSTPVLVPSDKHERFTDVAQDKKVKFTDGTGDRRFVQRMTAELLRSCQIIRESFPDQFSDKPGADDAGLASRNVVNGLANARQIHSRAKSRDDFKSAANGPWETAIEAARSLENHLFATDPSIQRVMNDVHTLIRNLQSYTFLKCGSEGGSYTFDAVRQNLNAILNDSRSRLDRKTIVDRREKILARIPERKNSEATADVYLSGYLTTRSAIGRRIIDTAKYLGRQIESVDGDPATYHLISDCVSSKLASLGGPPATTMLALENKNPNATHDQLGWTARQFVDSGLLEIQARHAGYAHEMTPLK